VTFSRLIPKCLVLLFGTLCNSKILCSSLHFFVGCRRLTHHLVVKSTHLVHIDLEFKLKVCVYLCKLGVVFTQNVVMHNSKILLSSYLIYFTTNFEYYWKCVKLKTVMSAILKPNGNFLSVRFGCI